MDAQRQAINNSVFNDEQDIGKAVSDWTHYYNKKHDAKQAQSVYRWIHLIIYTTLNRASKRETKF